MERQQNGGRGTTWLGWIHLVASLLQWDFGNGKHHNTILEPNGYLTLFSKHLPFLFCKLVNTFSLRFFHVCSILQLSEGSIPPA